MLETILRRRSVRRFADRPVDDATVLLLLRAAMQAPSAKNERPWEYLVVRDRETLSTLSAVSPYAKSMEHAPMGIVLLCNKRRLADDDTFWQQDMAATTQTFLLAAAGLGLGATWLAIAPLGERIAAAGQALRLPEHVVPFAMLPLGYPLQERPPDDRFEVERIFNESYR